MRSAGRVSRLLVVLGFLSLLLPGTASAGTRGQARKVKSKDTAQAKKSKEKMALARAKQGQGKKKGEATAAGFLPRPGAKPATGKPAGAAKLAATRTASVSKTTARARTTKAKRPIARKTRTVKKTRKPTAAKRRAARTSRTRSRSSSQEFDTAAAAAQAEEAAMGSRELGAMDMGQAEQQPQSRFRRFMSGAGKVLRKSAKYAGYALVVAAPAAVLAIGGLPIAFAIGAPAIFLGIPMVIGLAEQAAKRNQGIDDPQQEMLERYMSRQMIDNHDLNGPGPGNGVVGAGGLNTLNNMIDPGGMR